MYNINMAVTLFAFASLDAGENNMQPAYSVLIFAVQLSSYLVLADEILLHHLSELKKKCLSKLSGYCKYSVF